MLMDWFGGIGIMLGFCLYMFFANWGWWKVSGEKLWEDPVSPFAWIILPILVPIVIGCIIGIIFLCFIIIPVELGRFVYG